MDDMVSMAVHKEFAARMETENKRLADEDNRQNKRLDMIEESVRQFQSLVTSVEKLAVNMESMLEEQKEQGKRLEKLEARDGEMWRTVTGYIITAIIGIVVGLVATQIGL